jgi:hypothetical protein
VIYINNTVSIQEEKEAPFPPCSESWLITKTYILYCSRSE